MMAQAASRAADTIGVAQHGQAFRRISRQQSGRLAGPKADYRAVIALSPFSLLRTMHAALPAFAARLSSRRAVQSMRPHIRSGL